MTFISWINISSYEKYDLMHIWSFWNIWKTETVKKLNLICILTLQVSFGQSPLVTSVPVSLLKTQPPDSQPSVAPPGLNCASSRVFSITLNILCWAWNTTPTSGSKHTVISYSALKYQRMNSNLLNYIFTKPLEGRVGFHFSNPRALHLQSFL